jgi:putative SOS response-associated peptidase YedK
MPAIIPLAQADAWLHGANSQRLLLPYPADTMEVYQASRKIFGAHNEGADLILPINVPPQRIADAAYAHR